MYTIIYLLLLALGAFFIINGLNKKSKSKVILGVLIAAFTIIFFWFMDFWGEMLWFDTLGYDDRFWIYVLAQSSVGLISALIASLLVNYLTYSIPNERTFVKIFPRVIAFIFGGIWGLSNWDTILKFWYSEPANITEPILNKDAGFYLFTLPLLESIYTILFLLLFLSIVTLIFASFFRINIESDSKIEFSGYEISNNKKLAKNLIIVASLFILLLAYDIFLNRYELLFSERGIVKGPGWTDVNIMLPAYWIVMILMILLAVVLWIPVLRSIFQKFLTKLKIKNAETTPILLLSTAGLIFIVWLIFLTFIPFLFQSLRVEPNEITLEEPYIKHNIDMTRFGFNLHNIEEHEFPASDKFTENMVENNKATFDNIRLWDWRALDAVYKQFQEIRLYYEFQDVDIDRYDINGMYREVMISAREMNPGNLPRKSQTFVNKRFKYTHGYGITLTTVSDFTKQGLPNLLIKDIPPKSKYESLKVKRPQIYYGELTNSHVIVNSREPEFDYPSGEENVNIQYPGSGGVEISNIWRKFLFGWKFDGTQFFFSSYPTSDSRIMFHREIEDRVKTLAPFLKFDDDPYIVLGEDGNLFWLIDAYTTSKHFPYSETYNSTEILDYKEGNRKTLMRNEVIPSMEGVNYVRNSVKVVIDAFNGSVEFYIYDESDPIIKVWDKIFPGFFKNREEVPEYVEKHVRYPIDFFLMQGLMYSKYHMTDPTVFYNQEDLWVRATEKYYNQVTPVDPYYIMWELPQSDDPEFVLILPFTPKNRQVSIGWIAGMCDPENYGKFMAYKFPKEKRVLGPQQVETKIDQDSFLSGQLSLWNQRGSRVIRGNVLAIPVENTLLYVEPIYLQAETAAYPELRLVAVMQNDDLSYAETFDEALQGLYGQAQPKRQLSTEEKSSIPEGTISDQIKEANQAFENYLKLQSEKKFEEAAKELNKLQQLLESLSKQN